VKGPYLLLWYLLVKDGVYRRFALPRQGRLVTALLCIRAFLTYPNISLIARAKNILLVAGIALTPRGLRMLLERRMVDYGAA